MTDIPEEWKKNYSETIFLSTYSTILTGLLSFPVQNIPSAIKSSLHIHYTLPATILPFPHTLEYIYIKKAKRKWEKDLEERDLWRVAG